MSTIKTKSEILFLYESTYSIPNGDPFTGEQRYDEETKKILVSDVRIKRFIRDYLFEQKDENGKHVYEIYVWNDQSQAEGKESGSAARMKALKKKYENDVSIKTENKIDALKLLQKCIDVKLFGGISTEEKDSVNLTGPIQFALLNPSLNEVELRMHQNTSVFVSSVEKSRGSIGTTTVVPYAINQIHGWINPYSAAHTNLTNDDVMVMLEAMWDSINNANTRTKSNQNSLLLLQIVYSEPNKKLYGLDRLITIDTKDKKGEQLRSIEDYDFEFEKLIAVANSDSVSKILYHSEVAKINVALAGKTKFEFMFPQKEGEK
ncbi:MAG: type I-B CRISPR-associated protein Cas7/Csh2 [Stygiobacter sp.]|nr:MAG: type I-B CRISPR-associated protein Cas7/Csh2 [Stygiobacter sp.]